MAFFGALNFGFGQILTFEFAEKLGNELSVMSNSNDANLSTSTITRGEGLTATINGDRFNAVNWSGTSILDAISQNDYMQFTISPNSGYQFDVSSIVVNFQRSFIGPNTIALRSSIDGYSTTIDFEKPVPYVTNETTQVITFTVNQSTVATAITYRIYGWATDNRGSGGFEGGGNDIIVNGSVTVLPACSGTPVTYNGGWIGTPDLTTPVIIETSYDTSLGSFQACRLTINPGVTLNVNDNSFVEVQNDVSVDGTLTIQTNGNFVQYGNSFTVNPVTGTAFVNKSSAVKQDWFYYTYWSSPVVNETIEDAFPFTPVERRFWFNAANYNDRGDGIDLEGDDWTISAGTDIMEPGRGYAATSFPSVFPPYPFAQTATFTGEFNTGDIPINIFYNASNPFSYNLIGNPYPSAIDFNVFYAANSSVVAGAAYFWSQASPPDIANPGNEVLNFNLNDYAIYTVGSGGVAGGGPDEPTQYIPSGQGFFIAGLANGTATFTNAMRMADASSNTLFFKNSNSKNTTTSVANKLWINLTSDNGVFNQILVAYVNGATNENDGLSYDAPKLSSADYPVALYSKIENSNQKFAIQGKAPNSLTTDEVINLGFKTSIDVATLYTLSIAKLQGDFLTGNPVYIKDNLTNTIHDLSTSDYTFTSEVGEFNDRFQIVFKSATLATNTFNVDANTVKITQVDETHISFKASNNLNIKTVTIFDLLGRSLYQLKGNQSEEVYNLSNLRNTVFIAKITLSNGVIVTKKAVKQ